MSDPESGLCAARRESDVDWRVHQAASARSDPRPSPSDWKDKR
jgi:hypothetical protein